MLCGRSTCHAAAQAAAVQTAHALRRPTTAKNFVAVMQTVVISTLAAHAAAVAALTPAHASLRASPAPHSVIPVRLSLL